MRSYEDCLALNKHGQFLTFRDEISIAGDNLKYFAMLFSGKSVCSRVMPPTSVMALFRREDKLHNF